MGSSAGGQCRRRHLDPRARSRSCKPSSSGMLSCSRSMRSFKKPFGPFRSMGETSPLLTRIARSSA